MARFQGNTIYICNSDVSMFTSLVPALKMLVTPTRTSPSWQKPIACIWENAFDGLCQGLPICYSSVVIAMRIPLNWRSLNVDFSPWRRSLHFSTGSHFLALEKHCYCVHSHRRLYSLSMFPSQDEALPPFSTKLPQILGMLMFMYRARSL